MTRNISDVRRAENRVRPRKKTASSSSPRPSTSDAKDPAQEEEEERNRRKLYWSAALDDREHWVPGLSTAFKILVSLRMSAGIWSPVGDCDEVFNYWEPLHFLLYGTGFQTWEYSPLYAIRSWAYLLLHAAPVRLFQVVLPHTKVTTFFYLRCFLGLGSAAVETYLYSILRRRLGNGIARLYVLFSALSAAMFVASTAFLPSSFSMTLTGLALALWLDGRLFLATLATAVSALVGWPFAALLGLPVVAGVAERGQWKKFLAYAALSGLAVCGTIAALDSHFYGKPVLAPLNILLYNVFSEGTSSELYGTAPLSFYLLNLGLNWNVCFPLALVAAPTAGLVFFRSRPTTGQPWSAFWPVAYLNAALLAWLAVFFRQAHKEERFLFPAYPLIALCAAVSLDALEKLVRQAFAGVTALRSAHHYLVSLCLLLFLSLSGSRALAVYRNYHAPFDVYMGLGERLSRLPVPKGASPAPVQVCVGKEWHRYPSSFFLPSHAGLLGGQPSHFSARFGTQLSNRSEVRVDFVRSAFRGLLPGKFPRDLGLPDATRLVPEDQNEMNQEEPRHYVPLESCDYLIDLAVPSGTQEEPNFARLTGSWSVVHSEPFLVADLSEPLFRAFFVPLLTDRHVTFASYNVLQRLPSHTPSQSSSQPKESRRAEQAGRG